MRLSVFVLLAAVLIVPAVQADVVVLESVLDNTLFDDTAAPPPPTLGGTGGELSNGVGPHFFSGLAGELKRGLVAFDTSSIPPGSIVTDVVLTLNMNRTQPALVPTADVSLHRVLSAWGEGTSNSGGDPADPTAGGGGAGIQATTGDATWLHTFYATAFWTTPGGDFAGTPSATTTVIDVGPYSWTGAQLAADVQAWASDPASNFGWIVIGDEANAPSVKRFSTREADDPTIRPTMQVTFTPPVTAIPTLGTVGFAILMALLAVAGMVALRRRRVA